jgi:hypothetical protein
MTFAFCAACLALSCAIFAPEASDEPEAPSEPEVAAVLCEDPRPEICTYDYTPVCAQRDTGIRCVRPPCPATEPRTYANACAACSDPKVLSHVTGACPETE